MSDSLSFHPLYLYQVFRSMSKLIQQCWLHDGDARLTSQRLKRNLYNLQLSSITDKKDNENSSGK